MAAMGMGLLGDRNITFKRKFRWTFDVKDVCGVGYLGSSFVKVAARPSLDVEETEINYLNAKTWIPGKGSWNSIQVTYYDIALTSGSSTSYGGDPTLLLTWIRSVYDYADPINLHQGSRRQDYTATGVLTLYDGCGAPLEQWTLNDMWPQAIDFGDLDFSSSDTVDIQLTLRYSGVAFEQFCGRAAQAPCCTSC